MTTQRGKRMQIPKNISQEVIDYIYSTGYEQGLKDGKHNVLKENYGRIWASGLRQAIRLRPRYYRPHNEQANKILDPYFDKLNEATKNPPTPHKRSTY